MSESSVYTFLANFQRGGFRPNRYRVNVTFPAGVNDSTDASRKISFTCTSASLPSSNIGIVTVPYMGRPVKLPGDKTFDDWTVQVVLDNDFLGRRVFEQWHDMLLGFESNVAQEQMINPANAFATATVYALDRAENVLRTYTIEGMFPSVLGEVTLGYDQNDQVAMQSITFAVNGWKSDLTS